MRGQNEAKHEDGEGLDVREKGDGRSVGRSIMTKGPGLQHLNAC